MLHCAMTQVEGVDTEKTIRRAIQDCRKQLAGRSPSAGLVFATGMFDHGRILSEIASAFPGLPLIGCTTAGEFTTAYGFSEDSIILCLPALRDVRIGLGLGRAVSKNPEAAVREAVRTALAGLGGEPPALGLIFPSPLDAPMGRVLTLLNDHLGPACPVFGAGAGADDAHMTPLRQFFNTEIVSDCLPLVLLAGPIRHSFAIARSWTPVGPAAVVTRSSGRRVFRIDDKPALDFYQHYLGPHDDSAAEFPLAVREPDMDDFYLRGPIHYDLKERSITFTDAIPEGARIQLSEVFRNTLLEDARSATEILKSRTDVRSPSMVMAFSCSLRREVLGSLADRELKLLREATSARVPVLGFYAYGEISPLVRGGKSFFHNATLVALMVGTDEKKGESLSVVGGAAPRIERPAASSEPRDPAFLERKLFRAKTYCKKLEDIKEQNVMLHRQILREMDLARQELTRKEQALRRSEEKYRRIIETANQGFILMDENMIIRDVNDAYCRMVGYGRHEIVGNPCFKLASDDFRQYMIAHLDQLRAMEQRKVEGTLITRSGRKIPILILGSMLRDDQGRFLGNMAFITDLSEQRKALALAAEVQKSLLPEASPTLDGLSVAGTQIPCEEIGGDYFDYLYDAPGGPLHIAVGDITGHGVDAALLMTSARAFLRMRASQRGTAAEVITDMNRFLAPDVSQTGRFMTLFFMTLNPDRRSLSWVRAGHDPALIYHPRRDEFHELMGPGIALGLESDETYTETEYDGLRKGDIIAIGTDGLWEAVNGDREMFGKDRLRRTIRRHADADARTILEEIFDELTDFSRGTRSTDDITLVLVKIMV